MPTIIGHHECKIVFCILCSFFAVHLFDTYFFDAYLFAADAQYADPQSCAECHSDVCSDWTKSDHSRSMAHATEQSVHGDFNDATFLHIGFDDILLLSDDEVKTLLRKSEILLTDFVTATFDAKSGVLEKLRQNFTDTERNEFDAELEYQKSLQFHLYPKEQISKNDPLHWTKSWQNWNRMCADCHTTNLRKNFDPKTKEYKTTYSEINVGCQSCHGPCGKHVDVARKNNFTAKWNNETSKEVYSLANRKGEEIVDSCAFCHAWRRLLREGPKPPETPAADWLVPESADTNTYYPDGQLLEESFEYGSFVQSKMYSKGVGCTNCHKPHSLQLRFEGNRLCLQCHSLLIYNIVKHHFHPNADKPGTKCVECHFPKSTYMVVDPRYDHSIRKPSPALTLAADVPNACSICHRDRKKGETLEWARDKIDTWYAAKRKVSVGYSF